MIVCLALSNVFRSALHLSNIFQPSSLSRSHSKLINAVQTWVQAQWMMSSTSSAKVIRFHCYYRCGVWWCLVSLLVCPPRPEEIANPEVGPGTQNPSHFCDCSFSQTPSSTNAPQTKQPTGNATVKAYEASLNPDLVRNDSNRPSSSGEHESNSLQGSQEKGKGPGSKHSRKDPRYRYPLQLIW